jgi:predicted nucleotidyltransferase
MRAQDFIKEAFDKPYKLLRWEKGDYGDVDAIARLDDNTFLSIMFNKGFDQETKEEAWSVEFYRNNSQEKTGEGDQQRVFATVLSAVQTFVSDRVPGAKGKYKPNKIYFSASKEVKPDEDQRKAMTRARLYDSLVQRYAKALGFRAFRADTGNKVMYELSRIKPVAETINTDILNQRFKHKQVIGNYTYTASIEMFLDEPLLYIKAYDGDKEIGHILFEIWYLDGQPVRSHIESGGTEVAPEYRGQGVASTMYAYAKMLGNDIRPSWSQTSKGEAMWKSWDKSGAAQHLTGAVEENFADGKKPGKPVVDAIQKVLPVAQEIWFHGSRATGKHRKNSDTDILVIVPNDLVGDQYLAVVRILQKLSAHFDNYDIQPTKSGTNIHRIAQEEGQLLWSTTNENFADGKKPGRKGLAKRVGVNCKQPVSKLRSIAANSSGERQRMAHWCANMKSGRKK